MLTAADGVRAAAAAKLSGPLLRGSWFGRVLGPTLDLCCVVGPRRAVRELRAERRLEATDDDPDLGVYEPIWREAAVELGAEIRDRGSGFLEIRAGESEVLVWRNLVPLDNPVTLRLVGDKPAVHRLLCSAGLPTPQFAAFARGDLATAMSFLREHGPPCVVKPAFGTGRGRGVTCGVQTATDVRRAAVWASRWGRRLLIERQGQGSEYRILVLDGKVLDIVHRRPPHVIGDGHSTVAELIEVENRRRTTAGGRQGLFPISVNLDCLLALRDARLTLQSVPDEQLMIAVKHATNENGPDGNDSVIEDAGAGFLDDMRTAACAIGVRLASFEVVTSDIRQPLAQADGVIVEVNTTPGFHYHYQVANLEQAIPVAVPILQRLLSIDHAINHPK